MQWSEALVLYARDQARRGLAEESIKTRTRILRQMAEHCPTPWTVTPDDIDDWLDDPAKALDTRRCYLSGVAGFYRWAMKHDLIAYNPVDKIDRPKRKRRLPRPILVDHLALALGNADELMTAWLLLGARDGLRCCEISRLDRADVFDHMNPPMLWVRGKGDRERSVPLHPDVHAALGALDRGAGRDGPLFPNRYGQRRSPGSVSKKINNHLHRFGIPATAHQLRHRFATDVYEQSRDLRLTQELLGHVSPDTTAGYAAWSPGRAADVVASLPAFGVAFGA